MQGGQDEVGEVGVGGCDEGEDGDGYVGRGVVGLVVEDYAWSRGGGCWGHFGEDMCLGMWDDAGDGVLGRRGCGVCGSSVRLPDVLKLRHCSAL